MLKIFSGDDEQTESATQLGNVGWRDHVSNGAQVLVREASALLIDFESEELCRRETKFCFRRVHIILR